MRFAKNVAFGRRKHFLLPSAGFEIEHCIQCIELEEVMVSAARWRTRTPISNPSEIVPSLRAAAGNFFLFRHIVGELARPGGEIINHPVNPGARGRIRIVGN